MRESHVISQEHRVGGASVGMTCDSRGMPVAHYLALELRIR
jgi:hypothetical protein